jgi:hypothetical protein
VALAASGDTPEAAAAAAKAREALASLNAELLDTLAGQRARLIEELKEESSRLVSPRERATKTDTGELVSRALMLFRHYEGIDALIPAVMLERIGQGRSLTVEERQQLDGPVEDFLDRFMRGRSEARKQEREERRRRRRDESTTRRTDDV